eukprot:11169688-Lingulodinium_polyedra.AAC.1
MEDGEGAEERSRSRPRQENAAALMLQLEPLLRRCIKESLGEEMQSFRDELKATNDKVLSHCKVLEDHGSRLSKLESF